MRTAGGEIRTPYELLLGFADRTRPFVTHYADAQSRVELSVASTANGVAKAAGLLRDGLGLPPGALVSVDLPRHWQLPVWVLAALSAGARCGRGLPGDVDVRVIGPEGLAGLREGGDPRADEVLVSSCDAFGLPVPGGVPPGAWDLGVEVRSYPDVLTVEPGAAPAAALVLPAGERDWSQVLAAGPPRGVPIGARLWVDESTAESDLLELAAAVPLLSGGSVVLASGLDPDQAERIRAAEGAARLT